MGKQTIVEQILKSVFYSKAFKNASKLTSNSKGIMSILQKVFEKMTSTGTSGVLGEISSKVVNLAKLLKAYAKGEYRDVEVKNIAIILASFMYFLSPIDFIPDFLPIIGFGDDIALLAFVYNSLSQEIEKFELWNINKNINS